MGLSAFLLFIITFLVAYLNFAYLLKSCILGFPWGWGFCSLVSQYFVSRLSFYVPLCSTSVLPCVKLAPRSLFSCVLLFYFDNCCSRSIVWCLPLSFISVVSSCASHLLSPLLLSCECTHCIWLALFMVASSLFGHACVNLSSAALISDFYCVFESPGGFVFPGDV